jgi:hypothetical protein
MTGAAEKADRGVAQQAEEIAKSKAGSAQWTPEGNQRRSEPGWIMDIG